MGDRVMALGFGLFGVVWIVQSLKLNYWSDFAPGSGFLPFWLGVVIVALALVVLAQTFRRPAVATAAAAPPAEPRRYGRTVAIILGLFACLFALEYVGFVVAVGVYLGVLLAVVERRQPVEALLVAAGAVIGIWIVFKAWLKVPLPQGPWGF